MEPTFSQRLTLALAVLGVVAAVVAWWLASRPGHVLFIEMEPPAFQIAGSLPTGTPTGSAQAESDAVRAAQLDFHEGARRVAEDITRECANDGMDVACEGDWCVIRWVGLSGMPAVVRSYARRPFRIPIYAGIQAGYLDHEADPCGAAEHAWWEHYVGPVQQRSRRQAFCGARHRGYASGGPFPDPTPGRLCNALATFREGPEAAIYAE